MNDISNGRPVGWVVTSVGVEELSASGKDEVTAELEQVFSRFPTTWSPTGEDEPKVTQEHAPAEEHRPTPAIQTEVPVCNPGWITHGR